MDDELKRRIAATLDRPGSTPAPGSAADAEEIARLLETDGQARTYLEGLKVVDRALRSWPDVTGRRTDAEWEAFAAQIERRLGEAPWERTSSDVVATPVAWDPLDRPLLAGADDNESEHQAMGESHDENQDDDDLAGLAALTRTSLTPSTGHVVPPPPTSIPAGPSIRDDAMDESSGVVDIQKLAAIALKQEAPPSGESLKATEADTGSTDVALRAEPVVTKTAKAKAVAAVPAATSGADAKKAEATPIVAKASVAPAPRSNPMLWIGPILAVAAAGGFFYLRNESRSPDATRTANAHEEATQETAGAAPQGATSTVAVAPVAAPAPAMVPPAEQVPPPTTETAQPTTGAAPAAPVVAMAAPTPAVGTPAPEAMPGAHRTTVAANDQAIGAHEAEAAPSNGVTEGGRAHEARDHGVLALAAPQAESDRREHRERGAATRGEPTDSTTGRAVPPAAPPPPPAVVATRAPVVAAPAPAAAAAAPAAPAAGGSARSIDDLMAAAVGGPHGGAGHAAGGGAAPAAAAPALPDRPNRQQVTSTMAPLSPAVRACTQGQTGTATVAMMIQSDGTVTSASVSGPFSAEANSCITGVVRRAHFSPFTRPSVPIVFPFSIQPPHPGASE